MPSLGRDLLMRMANEEVERSAAPVVKTSEAPLSATILLALWEECNPDGRASYRAVRRPREAAGVLRARRRELQAAWA